MTALAGPRVSTTPLDPGHVLPYCYDVPQKGSTEIFFGALVALDASGYAVPGAATNTLIIIGWHDQAGHIPDGDSSDTTGISDGVRRIRVRQGVAPWEQSGTTITGAHVGAHVYCVDDQTVSLSSSAGARPLVGIVTHVDVNGVVFVQTGIGTYPGLPRAVSAWTQTYNTANRTVAAPTAVAPNAATAATPTTLTDSTGLSGTHDDTLAATTVDALTATALGDLVATQNTGWGANTEAGFDSISTKFDALLADVTAIRALLLVVTQNASDTAQKVIELVAQVTALAADDSSIRTQATALVADDLDNRQSITGLIDDLQALGGAA
jgi:hypothetical protein